MVLLIFWFVNSHHPWLTFCDFQKYIISSIYFSKQTFFQNMLGKAICSHGSSGGSWVFRKDTEYRFKATTKHGEITPNRSSGRQIKI